MSHLNNLNFKQINLVDFEFKADEGENPSPVCLVAWDLVSDHRMKIWQDDLLKMKHPPYGIDGESLFVAYYASAEIGCHIALGWPSPIHLLDLFVEFKNHTNGLYLPCGNGLLGALTWYGVPGIQAAEKGSMRDLILRGGPWTAGEKRAIIDYCESDVIALQKLLNQMIHHLDLPRALLRGRYMNAAAHIESTGIPIDTVSLLAFKGNWESIQKALIEKLDTKFGIYEGLTFKTDRFLQYLIANDLPWPRLASGRLDLKDETFREMASLYPQIQPIRELRSALSQMRLSALAVGKDGRNRTLLSAFRSRTGRNQPSNSKYIFGQASWLRGLIKPQPGYGLAYLDWSQQEFGIAAALSGDQKMIEAYQSGDPYLEFAKQAGAVPPSATKQSHKAERDKFKACVLAVQYGMGPDSLAKRIRQPAAVAKDLLRLHQDTYKAFWKWSDATVDYAMLNGKLWTTFGWTIHNSKNANPRFLRNFPMQGNGAEMLRHACCLAIEGGIRVCAPVHDAILIEAPLNDLEEHVRAAKEAMTEASELILSGMRLRTDAQVINYPGRFCDERGKSMWDLVQGIIA